jgi:ADP-ribosylglycohydrolase
MDKVLRAKNNIDSAKGCLMGAMLGDAIGAYLENLKTDITETDVKNAFEMKGSERLKIG